MTGRRALMLMDLQQAVCGPGGALGASSGASAHTAERGVLRKAAAALAQARELGDLVVHVRVCFDARDVRRTNRSPAFDRFAASGVLTQGSAGVEFCPEVRPADGELVVDKRAVSPFVGTGLDDVLRAHRIEQLVLGGVATNFVVESAARHAGDSGYRVVVVEDLCAAHSEELHRFAIERTLPVFARVVALADAYPALG